MDTYKNHTVAQLRDEISHNIEISESDKNPDLFLLIWQKEKISNHAVDLVRSLRFAKRFDETEEFHSKFKELYPDSSKLESERLWFAFSTLDKHENYTVTQLKAKLNNNFPNTDENISLYRLIWEKEKTLNNAVKLVKSLRKAKRFDETEKFHDKFKELYLDSEQLESERLWFTFSSKVCSKDNKNYDKDAQYILDNTSQESPGSKLIFEVTTLITISRLIREEEYAKAFTWTTKLNPNQLSDEGREGQNGVYYPSNRQQYYKYKAISLIGSERVMYFVNWVFEYLKFTEEKRKDFVEYIIKSCTYTKYDGSTFLSDMVLSNFLYQLDVDLVSNSSYLASKVNQPDTILLSELSQYLFCPVSFVINKSFNLPTYKSMDSSIKWLGNKDGFYDRYLKYQNSINISACFTNDTLNQYDLEDSVNLTDDAISIFEELFKGKIVINNYFDTAPRTFKSEDNTLKGAPDYLIELQNGKRVLIAEKFSSNSSVGATKIYDSDIIDIEAYLTKFKNLKIDYAYFINWIWSIYRVPNDGFEQKTNISYIKKVNIRLIDLKISRESLVDSTSEKINILKTGGLVTFNNIGFPSKCLSCSVYNYCEHKSGVNKTLQYPLVKITNK